MSRRRAAVLALGATALLLGGGALAIVAMNVGVDVSLRDLGWTR